MNTKILEEIVFTRGEIRVYFALLELGPSTTGDIIKKAKVSRSKVYEMLDKLKEKGLVSSVVKENTGYYEAANPKNIIEYLKKKKSQITQQEKELNDLLPALELKQKFTKERQIATMYEGYKGLKTIFNDILQTLRKGDEYYAFAVADEYYDKDFNRFIVNYHRKRHEAGIKVKLLGSEKLKNFIKKNIGVTKGIKTRFTKQATPKATLIFKDKVAMFVWEKNPVGVIITSKVIANQNKEFFQELWNKASS